ncbi:MAG: hypothetical protein ACLT0Y_02405 [Christensenellales bacterium]
MFKKQGRSAFRALKRLTLTECKIQALQKTCDMQSENGRTAFAQKAAALLKPLSPVERERYLKYIAKLSGFAAETILQQAEQGASPRPARKPMRPAEQPKKTVDTAVQERLLVALAEDPKTAARLLPLVQPEDIRTPCWPGCIKSGRALQGRTVRRALARCRPPKKPTAPPKWGGIERRT